ncbi:glutamate--cysteine ligase [Aeromicrobium sp. CF4.19]|uniref:carboxylate-amine ligase n=1 Tax=Aeromicrobium sp. CF4.19 TaxID=3373082 RepID=UPI003EE74B7C
MHLEGPRTVGVEEEMFLVDPATVRLTGVSQRAIRADESRDDDEDVAQELFLQQIESNTAPATDLEELRGHVVAGRRRAAADATAAGAAVLAVPTPLLGGDAVDFTPGERYLRMADRYGQVARGAAVCAMHVHVGVEDEHEGVAVIDRLAPWLPLLMALSAGSPFHHGVDTGYASWRGQVWDAWPTAGPVAPFGGLEGYDRALSDLVSTGAALDEGMIYFDARLARAVPTVEVRVADVCTEIDDVVLVAALSRALVATAAEGQALDPWRVELLRGARWLARREGLTGHLLDPVSAHSVPAADALARLLEHVDPALRLAGDRELVHDGVARLVAEGGPARRQREVAGPDVDVPALARHVLERTAASYA